MSETKSVRLQMLRYAMLRSGLAQTTHAANEWLKQKQLDASQQVIVWETGFAMTVTGHVIDPNEIPEYARTEFWSALQGLGGRVSAPQTALVAGTMSPPAPATPIEVLDPSTFASLERKEMGGGVEMFILHSKNPLIPMEVSSQLPELLRKVGCNVEELQAAGCEIQL